MVRSPPAICACPPPRRSPGVRSRCASTPKTRPRTSSPRPACSPKCVFPRACGSKPGRPRGSEVPPYYDPMLAKLIVHADPAKPRRQADRRPGRHPRVRHRDQPGLPAPDPRRRGVPRRHARPPATSTASTTAPAPSTCWKPACRPRCRTGRAVPATGTSACRPPGRWTTLALRAANRLVGNPEGAAGLECTAAGPTLRFNCDAVIALTGAPMSRPWTASPWPSGRPMRSRPAAVLKIGAVKDAGCRATWRWPAASTCPTTWAANPPSPSASSAATPAAAAPGRRAARSGPHHRPARPAEQAALQPPSRGHHWEVGVLYGPHGAPDFFTDPDIATFFATDWEVHYNSSRTGVRLIGPSPSGRAPTAARPACTPPTSTTTPTPSAPSTSPATCR
jgi:urea carboxylase